MISLCSIIKEDARQAQKTFPHLSLLQMCQKNEGKCAFETNLHFFTFFQVKIKFLLEKHVFL